MNGETERLMAELGERLLSLTGDLAQLNGKFGLLAKSLKNPEPGGAADGALDEAHGPRGRMVDIREASRITGLSVSELSRGLKAGIYPGYKVGGSGKGKWIVPIDELVGKIGERALSNVKGREPGRGAVRPVPE